MQLINNDIYIYIYKSEKLSISQSLCRARSYRWRSERSKSDEISNKSKSASDERSDPQTFGSTSDFILPKSLIPLLTSHRKNSRYRERQVQRRRLLQGKEKKTKRRERKRENEGGNDKDDGSFLKQRSTEKSCIVKLKQNNVETFSRAVNLKFSCQQEQLFVVMNKD